MRKFTTTLFDRVISAMAKVAVVVALLAAVPAMNSCSKDNTEETKVSGKGWTIASTISTDADGAAKLSCSGAKQSVSVTFSVDGEYEIDTDGSEWFTVAMNGTGTAGQSRVVKFNVAGNTADVMRTATAYITVKGKERVKFATLSQSVVTISDPVVKWIDERLSKEYYWLDEYNEKADAGEINYELAYNEFLSKALLSMKTNMDDGYIDYQGKRKLYSNIQRYTTTKADTRASQINGLGILLCSIVWQIGEGAMPNYGFAVEHVYPGSPAEAAGLQRGDIITSANGEVFTSANYSNAWINIVYSGYSSVTFTVMQPDDSEQGWSENTLTMNKGPYYENPVAYCGLLKENKESGFVFGDKKIGYIVYLSFEAAFDMELINSIKGLKAMGATDIIIDLRTNGGGSVFSASYFGSMLMSADKVGKNLVTLERHKSNILGSTKVPIVNEVKIGNEIVELPNLGLEKVYVITTSSTASASEMLVMGLRSQGVEAYTIGQTTNGKNCGMDVMSRNYGSYTYEFAPITFMALYDDYDVDYADGIVPNVDFTTLPEHFAQDSWMYYALSIFPIPDMGQLWGEYLYDVAVSEAVARTIGGTVFLDEDGNPIIDDLGSSISARKFTLPGSVKPMTRAAAARQLKKADVKVEHEQAGMILTEENRRVLSEMQME